MEQVSDGPSEVTSLTSDSSAVNAVAAGSTETSRRGRRNRRDRHKNGNRTTSDSVVQLMEANPNHHLVSQPPVNLADSQSSGKNKSSVVNSSSSTSATSSVGGKEMSKGSVVEPVKLSSFSVYPPPSSSITGDSFYSACCRLQKNPFFKKAQPIGFGVLLSFGLYWVFLDFFYLNEQVGNLLVDLAHQLNFT